jgi:hypothetical protein
VLLQGRVGAAFAHTYRVRLTRATREITLDGKRPERAVEYFGGAACVVFHPGDLDLVRGAPELRRRLLDRILVRTVDGYGEALKSLRQGPPRAQRAAAREGTPTPRPSQAYDFPSPATAAPSCGPARPWPRSSCRPRDAPSTRSPRPDAIALAYRPRAPHDQVAYAAALAQGLPGRPRAPPHHRLGPHGDDLALTWSGQPARVVASQGQTRALALALRLAELHVLRGAAPAPCPRAAPRRRVQRARPTAHREALQALVAHLGAQVWVTTTDPAIAGLVPDARVFRRRCGARGSEYVRRRLRAAGSWGSLRAADLPRVSLRCRALSYRRGARAAPTSRTLLLIGLEVHRVSTNVSGPGRRRDALHRTLRRAQQRPERRLRRRQHRRAGGPGGRAQAAGHVHRQRPRRLGAAPPRLGGGRQLH